MIGKGETHNYPANWKGFKKEIDLLLRNFDPNYKNKIYVTPGLYTDGIIEHPEKYPLLSKKHIAVQKRYISFYLKSQGRVPRGINAKRSVWMLPGAEV